MSKNNIEAVKFLLNGNFLYEKGRHCDALLSYNRSLCLAEQGTQIASMCYGKRSLVYFDLKEYDLSLANIEWAIQNQPSDGTVKFDDLKTKCLQLMETHRHAPDEDPLNFFKLSYAANKKLPCLSECLELRVNKKFGRHIISTRNLSVGDIVAVTDSSFIFFDKRARLHHCSHCSKSSMKLNLIPCTRCAKGFSFGLRLTEVRIPNHTVRDSSARLECHFDLDGEALYSVKWYKDGNEFYRYVPRDMPPAQVFILPGVSVDLHNSTDSVVVLQSVNLSTTGRYRCEVSAEAPSFQTVSDHGDMIVVALPDEGPRITGGRPRYQIGDAVRVNCTSGRSKPAALLNWFINGDPADVNFLRNYNTVITGREGLETSILGLEFRVRGKHFRRGDMKLKCLATIATVYWRSNEESVEGDKQQKAPVLESRETVPPGSRADRVQAGNDAVNLLHSKNVHLLTMLLCMYYYISTAPLVIIR